MKEFFRTFFTILLAGAILMVATFSWLRYMHEAETEVQRVATLVDHTIHQLDQPESLTEAATRNEDSKARQKSKSEIQTVLAEIISRIQSTPLNYPDELHHRAYALQRSLLDF